MTTPLTDQQLALRTALEAALRAAADQCTTDCPADCRTHHPSIFAGGMTATGLAESIDGDIDAVAHVAAITVQGEMDRLRAELADEQAAHAKTIDNFEGYSEDTATTLGELRARLDAVRNAARAIRNERDGLRAEVQQARSVRTAVLTVMEHYRDAVADASRWTILSDLAIARSGHIPEHLTPACTCAAELVHQAGCPGA